MRVGVRAKADPALLGTPKYTPCESSDDLILSSSLNFCVVFLHAFGWCRNVSETFKTVWFAQEPFDRVSMFPSPYQLSSPKPFQSPTTIDTSTQNLRQGSSADVT